MRQIDASVPLAEIPFVQPSNSLDLLLGKFTTTFRQDRDSILISFAVSDHDMALVEADVFDAPTSTFTMPQAGTVHHQEHQRPQPLKLGQDP